MAENEHTITTVFKADISNFSASTQQLNSYIKTVNSEFNVATASMGKWSDNTDGLQAKITQLNKTLEAEKLKLNNLETALADLEKEGKGNTAQAQKLQIAINQQKATVAQTEKAVDDYNGSLKELQDAGVKSRKELDKLNKEAEESKKDFAEAGNTIKNVFIAGIAGIAGACVGAVKGLSSIVESTAELRLEQGRVQTAFEQAGHSADTAKKIYNDFNAVLGDTAKTTEAMQHMAQLAKTEEELNTLVKAGTGIFATYGNSLPIESLMEAANETARTGVLTGALTDSINWAGKSEEEFQEKLDACNTEQERQSLIISTLNELYSQAGDAYQETNKDVIEATRAQDEYNNKMADIARKVQPAMTQFKTIMVDALVKVMETFSQADIEEFLANIANAVSSLVNNVLPPLTNILSWILDNLSWLAPTILSVVAGITAATVAYKTITGVMNLVKIAQLGLNGAMAANPIGLIVTAIGLLVTAFTLLWQKCEGFRNFWKNMWEHIKTAASMAKDFIVSVFTGIANILKAPINGAIALINGAIGAINKISVDIPDWVPVIGGKHIGFSIPKIPMLAEGGVIDKKTLAMIGENGKEAVVPLEKNTQWLDKLADTLAGKIQPQNNNTYNVYNTFEKMQTSRLALHEANLEFKRIARGNV
jgi:phage-related minor tail protein